jgi:hypothetical protein
MREFDRFHVQDEVCYVHDFKLWLGVRIANVRLVLPNGTCRLLGGVNSEENVYCVYAVVVLGSPVDVAEAGGHEGDLC